jgi:hypothetical protein
MLLPFLLSKASGFLDAMEEVNAVCEDEGLPEFLGGDDLLNDDYRVVMLPPRGIPFALRFEVIYKPESPDELKLPKIFKARL